MLLYKTKRYFERNILLKVPQRRANRRYKIQEQITLKNRGNKKSVVILGDSVTELLNGWEMAIRTQSNCKIYVKTFSGAAISCMEDYMKPPLRNSPDHFILHVV